MIVIVLTLLGAIVGVGLFDGFGGGVWSGAAIGALAGWLIQMHKRLQTLERELGTEREQPREPAPQARRTVPSRVSIYEPETTAAADEPAPEPAVPAREPAGSGEPAFIDRLIAGAVRWCTTGNVPVKVGVILSVFGVGFLVKEAIDRNWLFVPLPIRLMSVALFGVGLLILGWRLRESRPVYALSVQGGGIAVLYLTTYAAFAIYSLMPSALAFVLLVVVTAAAGVLAVLQDSRAFAVLGIAGGFMAPALASDGSGNHVMLFGYYAVLNTAVFGIAWFKAWRVLNVLGFLFTFVIGALWGYTGYRPESFASTEPFLILFVVMYTLIPILFASQETPRIKGYVDGTLVFGTPIVGFGLQSQLVGDSEYGLALSAIVWALGYMGVATYLLRKKSERLQVLTEAFLGLGIVFLSIAIPLALDARWTSVAWSLQGAAMIWLGWRQDRRLPLLAGFILQGLAAMAFGRQSFAFGDAIAVFNGYYLGALIIALSAWFSAWVFDRIDERRSHPVHNLAAWILAAWGTLWWAGAGLEELVRTLPDDRYLPSAGIVFLAGTVVLTMLADSRFRWPRINGIGVLFAPALAMAAATIGLFQEHPLANYGWLAWPIAFVVHLAFLRRSEAQFATLKSGLHPLGYWVLTLVAALEVEWWVDRAADGVWPGAAVFALVAAMILGTLKLCEHLSWPLRAHRRNYVTVACGAVVGLGVIGMLIANLSSPGDATPLPYVPILNPLELVSILVVVTAVRWYDAAREYVTTDAMNTQGSAVVTGLVALFLLTMVVARTVHHWAGVPFDLESLARSDVLQASLSIVWGTTALAGMIAGATMRRRAVWIGGAALMAIVVVKLFLVELDNTGTVERVVSFLGVGLLLLVVGYFAPVPPRAKDARDEEIAEVRS